MEKLKEAKATNNKKSATAKNATAKAEQKPQAQGEPKKEDAKKEVVQKATTTIDQILNPTAESRVKKLEIFNKLADKKNRIDTKLDELTSFRVSQDGTEAKMEFSTSGGYRFKISNPVTINMLLDVVEKELSTLQTQTDKEILNFQI
tara:strand:- start:2912 stop:3352 length:441 start_codon:yes stop_codon:yes gene_type:complete